MTIGLIDVDGHNFPNLAIMKLAAYHKAQGDTVEWYRDERHYDIRLSEQGVRRHLYTRH